VSQATLHLVRRIAEHNPDLRSYWRVTESFGPERERCIDHAITLAQATGSSGAKAQEGQDNPVPESSATVERVYELDADYAAIVQTFDYIDQGR
jgi:hypothetical protein